MPQRVPWADDNAETLRAELTDVLENMSDGFMALGSDWGITYLNAAAERDNAMTRAQVLGKTLWEAFPDVVGTEIERELRRAMTERVPLRMEAFYAPHGRWYAMDIQPMASGGLAFYGRDITERKQAEAARQQAERERDALLERLRQQFERMPIACVISDPQIRIIDWNPAAERVFGYAKAEVVGEDGYLLLVAPTSRPMALELNRRLVTGDMTAHAVGENVTKDGRTIVCEWHNTPLLDADGRVIAILAMATDITARIRAEEALRASERSLAAALAGMERLQEVSTRMVQAGDSTSLLQEIVDTAIAITAADMGNIQLLDRETMELRIVASRGFERPFLAFFSGIREGACCGTALRTGERVVIHDITTSPVFIGTPALEVELAAGVRAVQSTPLVSRAGRLVGMLSTHYRTPRTPADRDLRMLDLLARQAADWIERTEAEAALRESERDSRRLAEVSSQLVPEGDIQLLLRQIIDAATEVTGAEMGSLQAIDHSEGGGEGELRLLAWQGQHAPWIEPADLDGGQRRLVPDVEQSADHAATGAADRHRRAGVRALQSTPLITRAGHRVGVISTYWRRPHQPAERALRLLDQLARQAADLIERHLAQAERAELLARERAARTDAERAARLKDEFLATLSHELRTPLSAIIGWTELIKRRSGDQSRVLRGIEVIARNARAQAQLVADLLDLSRIISGKMRLNLQRIELPVVIDAAIEAVRPAADARGIAIESVIEPVRHPVLGDAERLQQILWNILANAVKFTPDGGHVRVALARVEAHAEIRVSDDGKGIRRDFLPHLFERFRQADASASREHGGLGIGLALVKELTELHGGTVRAASEGEGMGATFVVDLPLSASEASDGDRAPGPPPARCAADEEPDDQSSTLLQGVKVLVVDDEPDAREMIQRILEDSRAEVTIVSSVSDALIALEAARFDVLLSDIGMPRRDGYQLIAEIRRRGVETPAAAVTAFARSEDRTRALRSGYQAHLSKPLEPCELVATVASLAGRLGP